MSQEKPVPKAPAFVWIVPHLTKVARECGYALGIHGSVNRDLDLMAMPWTEEAVSAEELAEALRSAVDGRIVPDGTPGGKWDGEKFVTAVIRMPELKPHGRLAWNIHFCGHNFYIDLSVMPRQEKAQ